MRSTFVALAVAVAKLRPALSAALPRDHLYDYSHGSTIVVDDGFGPLRFKEDGTFQISIFEDLHFGESALVFFSFLFNSFALLGKKTVRG